jgi:uncharacterized membrane protein (DUF4010 family)
MEFPYNQSILPLLSALAIGLLVGVERGWAQRDAREGQRIAGVRTYALLGLLGGLIGVVSLDTGAVLLAAAFAAVGALVTAAYVISLRANDPDLSITGAVASLATFMLAVVAGRGDIDIAGTGAVVTVVLLGLKPELHGSLERINRDELKAVLKLLVLSVVLLPILPDQAYGPWNAINPRGIWWLVILIAALSFAGYVAVRVFGPTRGIMATGLFGGLASSTALTLHFSRLARRDNDLAPLLGGGILLASATMFLRTLVIVGVVNWQLVPSLVLPLLAMVLVSVASASWLGRRAPGATTAQVSALSSPVAIMPALGFGALLALVLILTAAAREWFGASGVMVVATISGFADVDAIAVSMAQTALSDDMDRLATAGVVVAATANTASKAIMAGLIGGRGMARHAVAPILLTTLVGAAATLATLQGVMPAAF